MRLCLEAGIIDYETTLKAIPPRIIDGWMAFDRIEGISRDNFRAAVQTATSMAAMAAETVSHQAMLDTIRSTLALLTADDVFSEVHRPPETEPADPADEARRELAQLRALYATP